MIIENDQKDIKLFHQGVDQEYWIKNKGKHRKNYNVTGVEIRHKRTNKYILIFLGIYGNLIQHISLPFDKDLKKEFDFADIRVGSLKIERLKTENIDKKALQKILKGVPDKQLEILEIEDTFEIEVGDKLFYTIFDMEDGNYVVVDKKGVVYRLIHDHEQVAKKIADSVEALLLSFSGDKRELDWFMD